MPRSGYCHDLDESIPELGGEEALRWTWQAITIVAGGLLPISHFLILKRAVAARAEALVEAEH
jgi:hypothetical protein